ncbi:MAG: hypothetical protein CVV36_01095 [Candidatus Methanoperedenaceae archaeon HGW-Methanoperedenaceae-1]|nr:MAG: hypothetical protein CVV36_01095 [Candidatus Methanoperedenaceae archaeon HGW-Methanoperedenaceae-1]
MAINLGMDKPFRPDKDVDFITSVTILSIFNLVIYVINQVVGIIIWILIALSIIGFLFKKVKKAKKGVIRISQRDDFA